MVRTQRAKKRKERVHSQTDIRIGVDIDTGRHRVTDSHRQTDRQTGTQIETDRYLVK